MAERLVAVRRGSAIVSSVPLDQRAGFGARCAAYFIDSLALFGFAALFSAIAFLNIFVHSDEGRTTASDEAIWNSAVLLILTAPCWALVNILLTTWRKQTVGQFVMGLQMVQDDGEEPGLVRLIVYWLALHPVLFHPVLAGFWVLLAYTAATLSQGLAVIVVSLAIAILCLVGPVASLVTALSDPERRGIHDRIAGMVVTRLE